MNTVIVCAKRNPQGLFLEQQSSNKKRPIPLTERSQRHRSSDSGRITGYPDITRQRAMSEWPTNHP